MELIELFEKIISNYATQTHSTTKMDMNCSNGIVYLFISFCIKPNQQGSILRMLILNHTDNLTAVKCIF